MYPMDANQGSISLVNEGFPVIIVTNKAACDPVEKVTFMI